MCCLFLEANIKHAFIRHCAYTSVRNKKGKGARVLQSLLPDVLPECLVRLGSALLAYHHRCVWAVPHGSTQEASKYDTRARQERLTKTGSGVHSPSASASHKFHGSHQIVACGKRWNPNPRSWQLSVCAFTSNQIHLCVQMQCHR